MDPTIALQLEDGSRLTHQFPVKTTLYDVVNYFQKDWFVQIYPQIFITVVQTFCFFSLNGQGFCLPYVTHEPIVIFITDL